MLVRMLIDWLFGRGASEPTGDAAPADVTSSSPANGRARKTRNDKPAVDGPTFNILVTRLAGDQDGTLTNRLMDALAGRSDCRIVYIDQPAAEGVSGAGLFDRGARMVGDRLGLFRGSPSLTRISRAQSLTVS